MASGVTEVHDQCVPKVSKTQCTESVARSVECDHSHNFLFQVWANGDKSFRNFEQLVKCKLVHLFLLFFAIACQPI